MAERPQPAEEVKRLYDEAEARTAKAMEELVGRDSFGELLARVTENVLGVMKIGGDAAELALRNLRLAGRRDVTDLARQLARTEDKLELVLQEVERLRDELGARERAESDDSAAPAARRSSGKRSGSRS